MDTPQELIVQLLYALAALLLLGVILVVAACIVTFLRNVPHAWRANEERRRRTRNERL